MNDLEKALLNSRIQKFLKNNLGSSGRGFTTLEIKKAIQTELTCRKLLPILNDLYCFKILHYTGHLKNKRFVLFEYKYQADYNFNIDSNLRWLLFYNKNKLELCDSFEGDLLMSFSKLTKKMSFKRYCQTYPQFQKIKL